jgi:hypothetical protein
MELIDERSSAKVFYQTLTGEQPEMVQSDTKLAATDDQEIVDVILSGRVSTSSPPLPFILTRPVSFQSEHHIQLAWGFSGRVRISDGLVVLIRQPVRPHHSPPIMTFLMTCSLFTEIFRVVPSMSVTVSLRFYSNLVESNFVQQCCPRRTLLANGSTALLALNGKVSGP